VTASDVTVMITGESGTGKELVARSIWKHSHRAGKPFIAVNCAAIPDNLIESELFGHEKGSFTGATGQRLGKFELCDGGTIFLDEIGDMALATQTKILRVLQQGDIQRVGGTETIKVDVRILAATNKDLEEMVKAKTFREDLYYRLNVVRIRMPALRERGDDVPQIVDFCLQNLVKQRKARVSKVSPEAMAILVRYRWPGNVRELENVIYRSAVIAQGDAILVKNLPKEILEAAGEVAALPFESAAPVAAAPVEPALPGEAPLTLERAFDFIHAELARGGDPLLPQIERAMRARALLACAGDEAKVAAQLGLPVNPVEQPGARKRPAPPKKKKLNQRAFDSPRSLYPMNTPKRFAGAILAGVVLLQCAVAFAAAAPKKILFFSKSSGFEHDAIKTYGEPKFGYAFPVLKELGAQHNIEFTFSKDGSLFTPEYLAQFDAFFSTRRAT